jgi:hypothetical protein
MSDQEANMLITFEHTLSLVRIVGTNILPSNITLKADIYPSSEDVKEDDFDLALSKAKFWLENIASRCVVFSKNNPTALKLLLDDDGKVICNNLLMMTPTEPTDDQLGVLFQSKLTALSGGVMSYGDIQVKSSNYSDLTFTFVGDTEDVLPENEEWVGPRSYFDAPWWNRDDSSTMDIVPPADADLNEKPVWAYSLDFLSQAFKSTKSETIIQGFTPTVIDGGKTDE